MSDSSARERALDTTKSFIVQAPAGSGKTELLISRYISLLATVNQPEEILAMSFTRKSTAEMQERVLNLLAPNSILKPHQEPISKAVERVRKKSKALDWDLQNQPSRLQIKTMDSLVNNLVRNMPWSSRFGGIPGTTDKLDDLLYEAVEKTVETIQNSEHSQSFYTLLHVLDNSVDRMINLIVEMLRKRDQWLRIVIEHHTGFEKKARAAIEQAGRSLVQDLLDDLRDQFPATCREIFGLDALDHSTKDGIESWIKITDFLLTKGGHWRKTLYKKLNYFQLEKEEFLKTIECCREVPQLKENLNRLGRYCPFFNYKDEHWKLLDAISIVLIRAVAQLKLEFRERGEVDFIERAQQATVALGTSENPTDLMLVLDYRFQHILVDEFQDTSASQLNLIHSLINGWQVDDGRTLFLVGDPMQSIYRFRQAEVGIFLSVKENGIGDLKPEPLQLIQNFRSNCDLVDWYNAVFTKSFPKQDNILRSRVSYASATTENDKLGSQAVHIQFQPAKGISSYTKATLEAKQLVSDLKNYLDRTENSKSKAAILIRARNHAEKIIPLLQEQCIAFYAEKMFPLSDRMVVKDLLSLTRALLRLENRTAWFAVLRAPWCGLTLNDMLKLASDKQFVWQSINKQSILEQLSSDGRRRLRRVRKVFERAFLARGQLDLRQWVEDTWMLLGGPACIVPTDLKNAQIFLDRLEQYSKGTSLTYLNQFEEKLKDLYAVPELSPEEVRVHISTIHNVKGLQFDAVFLPSFHRPTRRSANSLFEWAEVVDNKGKQQFIISPINDIGTGNEEPIYKFLKKWNGDKDIQESIRLTYVACTRAKDELFIYAAQDELEFDKESDLSFGHKFSMLRCLAPGIIWTEGKYVNWCQFIIDGLDGEVEPQSSNAPIIARLPEDWELPKAPSSLQLSEKSLEAPGEHDSIRFDWAGSVAVWVGIVVHKWLERISVTGLDTWNVNRLKGDRPKWKTQLQLLGLNLKNVEQTENALHRIEVALTKALGDVQGRWLLSSNHCSAKTEYLMTSYVDGRFRNVKFDRTFIDNNNVRWIVDYKTGYTEGNADQFLDNEAIRYRSQLMNYKRVLSNFESRTIRTALYFPMFPAWREIK